MADQRSATTGATATSRADSIFRWGEILSWSWVGWYVALLVGLWGAMMGTGDYDLANLFFILAGALFCLKWGHITHIHRQTRRPYPFITGVLVCVVLVGLGLRWTHYKSIDAEQQKRQLAQLDQIPVLKRQVGDIPVLKQKVEALTSSNQKETSAVQQKQETIEGLTRVVIQQSKQIASVAHKELAQAKSDISGKIDKTEANLATNINQYRTDTSTAVGKILRPGRTLGDKRNDLVRELKKAGPGMHQYAITVARGNQECLDFSVEIEAAFKDAGWTAGRTKSPFT